MASVHKRPNTQYWFAAWRSDDGKPNLRSTKQTDRNKALTIALEWERVDRKIWKGEMVESQVRQVINEMLERVGEPSIPIPGTAIWLREWITDKEANKSEGTAVRYKGVIEDFIGHLAARASKPLTSVTARDIQSFLTKRKNEGMSSTTIVLDAKILRAAFNRARRQNLVQSNPAEAVDLPEKESIERGVFTPVEIKLLVDAAKESEWATVILFGFYTGASSLSDLEKQFF
ncbi:MAG: phage integrase SAM-like domain-containing protein [Verrucomicrobiota bacterium]